VECINKTWNKIKEGINYAAGKIIRIEERTQKVVGLKKRIK
jgi:hypothetical protein